MKLRLLPVLMGLALGVVSAAAGKSPEVQHFTSQGTPFVLDLSPHCDVEAVGYDTGIVNYIAFRDSSGVLSHDIYIQSLSTILTNPANGKVIEIRSGFNLKSKYTNNPDGSLTIENTFSGLNVLYQGGERTVALAGQDSMISTIRFDEQGNVTSVDVVESSTPHQAHSFPLFCELLA